MHFELSTAQVQRKVKCAKTVSMNSDRLLSKECSAIIKTRCCLLDTAGFCLHLQHILNRCISSCHISNVQWRRQCSKGARSLQSQKILQPSHPDSLFFSKKVDDLFFSFFLIVSLKTQAANAVSQSK